MFENQSSRRFVVSEGERRFFQDFGYLRLRGWLLDDMPWIIDAFEPVFADTYRKWNVTIDPTNRRYILAPFIDLSNELATLVDHPAIEAAFTALLGDSWGYLPGEGNYLHAGTGWHVDGPPSTIPFVKMAIYLDAVSQDTGCLQFIAGSHREEWEIAQTDHMKDYGVEERDIPGVSVPSEPGDIVLFRHTTYHATSGSQGRRRMFTLNACPPPTDAQSAEFLLYLDRTVKYFTSRIRNQWPEYRMNSLYGQAMRDTATATRQARLHVGNQHEEAVLAIADEYDRSPLNGWHF